MDEHTKQLLLLGREHYQKREFEKAEQMLRQVLETDDRLADVHDMLGVICHSRGNFAQAEHHFERALAINPSYTEAALNLAVTYNDRGKYEAARQVYARIKGAPGRHAAGARSRSPAARSPTCTPRSGRPTPTRASPREAIGEYEKAVGLCPQFADLRTKLGDASARAQRAAASARAVRGGHRGPPELRAGAHPARGHAAVAGRDATAAAEQWRRCSRSSPTTCARRCTCAWSSAMLEAAAASARRGRRSAATLPADRRYQGGDVRHECTSSSRARVGLEHALEVRDARARDALDRLAACRAAERLERRDAVARDPARAR